MPLLKLEDTYLHKGKRKALVREIKQKGISDERVLEAINTLPRHFFFDSALVSHAYEDKAFPIGEGQTISQPYTVAFQTQLLDVKPGQKNTRNRNRFRLSGKYSPLDGSRSIHD